MDSEEILIRVIASDASMAAVLDTVDAMKFNSLATEIYSDDLVAADNNRLAVILADRHAGNAIKAAETLRRKDVMTIVLATAHTDIPAEYAGPYCRVETDDMAAAVGIITGPFLNSGHINLDFTDFLFMLNDRCVFHIYESTALDGLGNAVDGLESKISPEHVLQVRSGLLVMYYNPDTKMKVAQIRQLSSYISTFPDDCDIVWGLYYDSSLPPGAVRLTLLLA